MYFDKENEMYELRELIAELSEIEAMTEDKACSFYNVDEKAGIIRVMREEIASQRDYILAKSDYIDDEDYELLAA